jgi:hypothetical protein
LARKGNTFSVLQFDAHLIARLRARRGDKGVEVLGFDREVLNGEGPSELESALKEFAQRHRLSSEPVYSILPRHEMTARILVLPSQDAREIEGMVRLNAEEYVPYPVEDLVIDQCVLQRLPDGEARILAAFAHRDAVDAHIAALESAGIVPEEVYMSTTCLASAAMAAHIPGEEPYAVVNAAPGGMEVLVLHGRRLLYSRGVASLRTGNPEELAEDLAVEVRASLSAYRRDSEDGAAVERLYAASEWTEPGPLCEALTADTGLPCAPVPLGRGLVTAGEDKLSAAPLAALGAALAAQGRAPLALRLTPESLRAAQARAARKRMTAVAAGLAALLLATAAAYYGLALYQRYAYLNELEARAAEVEVQAADVVAKSRQLDLLQRQVDPGGSALEVLARVSEAAPEADLVFTRFLYERGLRTSVAVRAKTTQQLDEFTAALREKGPLFAQAHRGPERATREFDTDVVDCTVEVPFPTAATPEGMEADDDD